MGGCLVVNIIMGLGTMLIRYVKWILEKKIVRVVVKE